jgi:hypothetical protein
MTLELETVAEVIGDEPEPTPGPFTPETLPDTPELPPPGIYFGMPEELYHALPALSSHGIRKLAGSPMLYWASSTFLSDIARKRREERLKKAEEKQHYTIGRAYHCRIMEGAEEFARRFAVDLSPEDCEGALDHTDEIKAAIGRFQCESTLKKDPPGTMVPVKPWSKVPDTMPDGDEEFLRAAVKADWIKQLQQLDPSAKILDVLRRQHREKNGGKMFISREAFEQIEIAARMVEHDPEVRHAFKDGYPEVVLIWNCARTGVPMKARVDYLKLKAIVDLKSIGNQRERSLEQAIRYEIAGYHYNVQPSVYVEGVEAVRELIRERKEQAIHRHYAGEEAEHEWALKWAAQSETEWLWVFQQKGDAPVTRGVFYPLSGTTRMLTDDIVLREKRRFRQFSETFGTDPWLDVRPIYDLADEDLPPSATEI